MTALTDNTQHKTANARREALRYSLIAMGVPVDTTDDFLNYHESNPEIWKHFNRFALLAAVSGKKIGAKAIFERVRWEVEIENSQDFKVNNNYAAYYARAFELKHPQYKGFFEFRTITGLSDGAKTREAA